MATDPIHPQDAAELRVTRLRAALDRHGWPYVPFAATGGPDLDQLTAMLGEADVRLEAVAQDGDGAWRATFAQDGERWTATAYSHDNAVIEAAISALDAVPQRVGPHRHRELADADAEAQRRG